MNPIDKHEEFSKLLVGSLPYIVDGGNEKYSVHFYQNKNLKREYALATRSFISFNSAKKISLMIFDIDYIAGKNAVDIFDLYEMVYFIYGGIGALPTYVCQTTKGYQFGFHLKKPVYKDKEKSLEYIRAIKIAITKALGCDVAGSHRLEGVWRNPLKHRFWYSREKDYELKQFRHLLEKKQKQKSIRKPVNAIESSSSNWAKIPVTALIDGQRHNKLYLMAVTYAYKAEVLLYEHLLSYLKSQNSYASPPLDQKEIIAMAKNVHKKKMDGILYLSKRYAKEVNLGVMEFEKMRGLTLEEYEAETKRRQSESAKRTNRLKAEKNGQKIIDKIQNAIKKLTDIEKEVTILGIAKFTGLSRNTVKKYLCCKT